MRLKKTISSFLLRSPDNLFLTNAIYFLFFTFIIAFPSDLNAQVIRKTEVFFYSGDSLKITADHYFSRKDNPYILLFHTESSSRGEYDSIANRFVKMNYNCIAVDLRAGYEFHYIHNMTARRARKQGVPGDFLHAEKDILAAIEYVWDLSKQEMILLGSSYSASLCLKAGRENPKIKAVMAFSPGEFFQPAFVLKDYLKGYDKSVFITFSKSEAEYIEDLTSFLPDSVKTIFKPGESNSYRGSGLLLRENPSRDEYWFAVLIFIKSLDS